MSPVRGHEGHAETEGRMRKQLEINCRVPSLLRLHNPIKAGTLTRRRQEEAPTRGAPKRASTTSELPSLLGSVPDCRGSSHIHSQERNFQDESHLAAKHSPRPRLHAGFCPPSRITVQAPWSDLTEKEWNCPPVSCRTGAGLSGEPF